MWLKNAEHVTVLPVVSANGCVYRPVVIFPGKLDKYRTRPNGRIKTPVDFLPANANVMYRDPAAVDLHISQLGTMHFNRDKELGQNVWINYDKYEQLRCAYLML